MQLFSCICRMLQLPPTIANYVINDDTFMNLPVNYKKITANSPFESEPLLLDNNKSI